MPIDFGYDASGRGNNWTANNLSSTAGAGNDSLTDTPTAYGTDTGAGGEVRGNYCTLNPINATSAAGTSLSNGNLQINGIGSGNLNQWLGTMGVSSGKWYYEVTMGENNGVVGISQTGNPNTYPGGDATSYGYSTGTKYNNNTSASYGATLTGGDVVGVAYDLDAGTITFYKNGVSQGQAYSGLSGNYFPAVRAGTTGAAVSVNFGQRPFAYTAPSGFKALCTQNLPTPTIGATSTTQANDYFNVVLWTGNGSDPRNITGVGFAPDFIWGKSRSSAYNHRLYDIVRGAQKALISNNTDAETTADDTMTAFLSDGFTVKNSLNTNADTYVAWNWNAGGSNATNTAGSITSTVRANTTSGFSIVSFNAGAAGNKTVGHGLSSVPSLIIMKDRQSTGYGNWSVFHSSVCTTTSNYLLLNGTGALGSVSNTWGSALPTSSVFGFGSNVNIAANDDIIAYCFAPVAGYSAFGSYTGNGSADGPLVYTGFRPRYVLVKRTDTGGAGFDWFIWDTARSTYNVASANLTANQSVAEGVTAYPLDINSNGLKIRNSGTAYNASGGTYIYAAFAESPFKYSLAR